MNTNLSSLEENHNINAMLCFVHSVPLRYTIVACDQSLNELCFFGPALLLSFVMLWEIPGFPAEVEKFCVPQDNASALTY